MCLEQAIQKTCLFAFLCVELWFSETNMKTKDLEPKFKQFSSGFYLPHKQTTKHKRESVKTKIMVKVRQM